MYQARALYNEANNTVKLFNDNCGSGANSRLAQTSSNSQQEIYGWNATIHPNPASNEIFVTSAKESEEIKIAIGDVNGRLLYSNIIKTSTFKYNVKLSLNDGIYFVTLSNSKGDKVVKKLIISK